MNDDKLNALRLGICRALGILKTPGGDDIDAYLINATERVAGANKPAAETFTSGPRDTSRFERMTATEATLDAEESAPLRVRRIALEKMEVEQKYASLRHQLRAYLGLTGDVTDKAIIDAAYKSGDRWQKARDAVYEMYSALRCRLAGAVCLDATVSEDELMKALACELEHKRTTKEAYADLKLRLQRVLGFGDATTVGVDKIVDGVIDACAEAKAFRAGQAQAMQTQTNRLGPGIMYEMTPFDGGFRAKFDLGGSTVSRRFYGKIHEAEAAATKWVEGWLSPKIVPVPQPTITEWPDALHDGVCGLLGIMSGANAAFIIATLKQRIENFERLDNREREQIPYLDRIAARLGLWGLRQTTYNGGIKEIEKRVHNLADENDRMRTVERDIDHEVILLRDLRSEITRLVGLPAGTVHNHQVLIHLVRNAVNFRQRITKMLGLESHDPVQVVAENYVVGRVMDLIEKSAKLDQQTAAIKAWVDGKR